MLPPEFYYQDALKLAPALLGSELVRIGPDGTTAGIIVETEAYHQNDPASHSFGGQTQRNAIMFGPGGHAYVYFTYGMHHCFNVVAGVAGRAEAVLIRALQPTTGATLMQRRRQTTDPLNLCSGPAKLVQAMGLGPADNGASLVTSELYIVPPSNQSVVSTSPRIGITKATAQPWRFFLANNAYVTKHKFNNPRAH